MVGDGVNYFTLDAEGSNRPGGRAGFQSCTLPEVSAEATEYREGTFKYTRKFSGVASVTGVSLMRGLALNDSALFGWMMDAIGGGGWGHSRFGLAGWSPAGLILLAFVVLYFTGNLR